MAPRLPAFRVGMSIAALVVTTVACSGSGGEGVEICARRGVAHLCLRSDHGGPFRVSGEGFEPQSALKVNVASGAGTMVSIDDQGRILRTGGSLGFLPGLEPEVHLLEGTDGSGVPVSFQITCSLGEGKRPLCRF